MDSPQEPAQRTQPLFSLGQLLATPGAVEAMQATGLDVMTFLRRHARGDWGDLTQEDKTLNDQAVKNGSRILSAYQLSNGVKLRVITEAESDEGRLATTILLPDEY